MHLTDGWVSALGSADGHDVALAHHALAVLGLRAGEADGPHVGLAAGVRTAGPVDFQFFREIQLLVQFLGRFKCLIFGVGQTEAAVGVAGT